MKLIIVISNYLQKNERINKSFEKIENLIQKHQPEISENQLINSGKNPNHERSENITKNWCNPLNWHLSWLSWAKDIYSFHSFSEKKFCLAQFMFFYVIYAFFMFFCLVQFTLFVYNSLIIVVENFQKYQHNIFWIQRK